MPPAIQFTDAEEPRAGAVFVHGQGDHVRRHAATFSALAARGISVAAPELPGHGEAGGRRGHIPGTQVVDALIDEAGERLLERCPRVALGIAGHSMGGLLVADRFARGRGGDFRWVWLSSPLVEVRHGKPRWLIGLGRWLSRVWPSLTIPTGVRPGDNLEGGSDPEQIARERASGTHDRVSVGWGMELLRASGRVSAAAPELFGQLPVLVTQGDADRVCPPRYSRELFEKLPSGDKRFIEIAGGRHEPWHAREVVEQVADWIATRAATNP